MPGKAHSPEQIVRKLRQVEVAVAGSKSVGQAVRVVGVTDHTYLQVAAGVQHDPTTQLSRIPSTST